MPGFFPLFMPTYGADLSKIFNSYHKFRQTVEGDSEKGRLFGRKFRLETIAVTFKALIVRPSLEILN